MSDPLQPYLTILAERGMVPFQREPWINPRTEQVEPWVLGERPPMRWRVSRDNWDRLEAWVRERHGIEVSDLPGTLFGWPIDNDAALPPDTIIFEAVAATVVAK